MSILLANVDDLAQAVITKKHACDVLACYVEPGNLRRLARQGALECAAILRRMFPSKPHLRSGDFGEMLIWRLLQRRREHPVFPLRRWRMRQSNNDTVRGIDLIGYVLSGDTPSKNDLLILAEVKTVMRRRNPAVVRQAYDGVRKNYVSRLADQLLFQQHNLIQQGQTADAEALARFAHPHKNGEYRRRLVAAVVHEEAIWDAACLQQLPKKAAPNVEIEVLVLVAVSLHRWARQVRAAAIACAKALGATGR